MSDTTIDRTRRIEYAKLREIAPADRNPKAHNLEDMRASMNRLGFVEPITLDERTEKLVSGHGRLEFLLAAEADPAMLLETDEAGEPIVPDGVIVDGDGDWTAPVNRGWASKDDEDAEAAIVALNRIGERAGWDDAALYAILSEQTDLTGLGYFDDDVSELARSIGELSRQETAFLEPFIDPINPEGTEPGDSSSHLSGTTKISDARVILEFPLTVTERDEVVHLINVIKQGTDAETSADALLIGLRRAVEQNA